MLLFLLAVLPLALGLRAGFNSGSGTFEWRDCGVGDKWVTLNAFDISPSPIKLPGNMIVSLDGTISHHLVNSVSLDVLMEKQLLAKYTKVPCENDVGTCYYTDPCHWLNTFKQSGPCPKQLADNGLTCTCPFNPNRIHLPASKFTVTSISAAWKFLAQGNYHVKITMNDKTTKQERACLEAYMDINA